MYWIVLFKNIKKYLGLNNYISINNKPVLSINQPLLFPNLNDVLLILRKIFRQNGIKEIFILCPLTDLFNLKKYISKFDAIYDLSENNLFNHNINNKKIKYYSGIIYNNIALNRYKMNNTIYRSSLIRINNNSSNNILNKLIIESTCLSNNTYQFIFLNSWNNYQKGYYLEPDEQYGYASINSFSKALFNLPFKIYNDQLFNLKNNSLIAIQAHIFYEDIITEIINKTNNIPYNFDLFITTDTLKKKRIIEYYIKKFSNNNKYEIKKVENKGRDILPFIIQMKLKIKKYKYICHIHTKKSRHNILLGDKWRKYIYENILGNEKLILGILSDFEKFEKLGFVFPEIYYDIIKNIDNYNDIIVHRPNLQNMNYVLNKLFPGYQIGNKIDFPSGDMFWAKIDAIHQIFNIKFKKKFPKELNQTNETIMHAIERIWLYLVKLNGFYYKTVFEFY